MSEKQQATVEFIRIYTEEKGYAPTEQEIGEWFGISREAAGLRVGTLERKGFIRRTPGVHRSIRLTKR